MFKKLLTLFTLSTLPILAELSYFPAQPAKYAPEELISYKSKLMEAMRYRGQKEKSLRLIQENRNDCVNDEAAHDGFTYSPLVQACQWKDADLVQALLEKGANPNHPRLEKMQNKLTPEIDQLLSEARSKVAQPAVTLEEWEKRYLERIGGRLFWSQNKKSCVSVTENNGTFTLWYLHTDAHGCLMPAALFYITANGFSLETVTRHSSLIQATLRKGDETTQTAMNVHDGYALHDFNMQPERKSFKLGHPICERTGYADLVNLSKK